MPCPEKFKETMVTFGIPKEIIDDINTGFENTVSSSPKKEKAEYFKRATEILCTHCAIDTVHALYEENACCKGGKREKESKAFANKYKVLSLVGRISHIEEVPYMGRPTLIGNDTIVVDAVKYFDGKRYQCACSNFNKVKNIGEIRKDYCYCCAGHFKHHYEIMLGVKLKTVEIVSSPLCSSGKMPCVIKYQIVR